MKLQNRSVNRAFRLDLEKNKWGCGTFIASLNIQFNMVKI
uniref:Uncharacterized protein n=1 Tax=Setaria italica TaxID=4555 RepID=K3Z2G3_SETIT